MDSPQNNNFNSTKTTFLSFYRQEVLRHPDIHQSQKDILCNYLDLIDVCIDPYFKQDIWVKFTHSMSQYKKPDSEKFNSEVLDQKIESENDTYKTGLYYQYADLEQILSLLPRFYLDSEEFLPIREFLQTSIENDYPKFHQNFSETERSQLLQEISRLQSEIKTLKDE